MLSIEILIDGKPIDDFIEEWAKDLPTHRIDIRCMLDCCRSYARSSREFAGHVVEYYEKGGV